MKSKKRVHFAEPPAKREKNSYLKWLQSTFDHLTAEEEMDWNPVIQAIQKYEIDGIECSDLQKRFRWSYFINSFSEPYKSLFNKWLEIQLARDLVVKNPSPKKIALIQTMF